MRIAALIALMLCAWTGAAAQSPKYLVLAERADSLMAKERWKEAETVLLEALRLEPGNFGNSLLLSNLGMARANQGRGEEAVESFTLGLAIAPRSSVLKTNRARTLMDLGRYDEALADLNDLVEADSLQQWPRQMRGLLLLARGDTAGGKADMQGVLRLDPHSAVAKSALARVARLEGDNTLALTLYRESLKEERNPDTWFGLIMLLIDLERYSEASEEIQVAVREFPDLPDFYLARGYLNRLNYRYDEAEIDKKIALDKGAEPQIVDALIPPRRK